MEILIAEDDKYCGMVIKIILESAGYVVILATRGDEAWQILQQENAPKLVVLDWMMPGMCGIDVLHKLRKKKTRRSNTLLSLWPLLNQVTTRKLCYVICL